MTKGVIHFLTAYLPRTPYVWVYMLQQVEYDVRYFDQWLAKRPDFRTVVKRKKLVYTKKASALLALGYGILGLGWLAAILLFIDDFYFYGVVALLLTPLVVLTALHTAALFGSVALLIVRRRIIGEAKQKLARHQATKIAVLGSFGKTTMKEILATVLAETKSVAATPGNNNVSISHARWVMNTLTGNEEVLIIEFGEFRPGDIASMASMFMPDLAVITGVAPNHLENYPDYDALKGDLASIQLFVGPDKLYVPVATAHELGLPKGSFNPIESEDVLGWKASDVHTDVSGTAFVMKKDGKSLKLKSGLIGEHLVEPLMLAAAIAEKFGATDKQIEAGVGKTQPFEHRMQPLNVNGATVIDDTYNGNIEGMRAGLHLLGKLQGGRKIYVTPGLVEQGTETEAVHTELGKLIAAAKPDKVVLIDNSVRPIIESSLNKNGYQGEIRIETDPLKFYTHLQYEVAAGDVVLMQNDWTDNYN